MRIQRLHLLCVVIVVAAVMVMYFGPSLRLRERIEWLASQRPRCMGALVWQLNDLWPGMSWSLIDSDGRPKPAYDTVREAFGRITP